MPEFTREGAFDHRPDHSPASTWSTGRVGGLIGFILLLGTVAVAYVIHAREAALRPVPRAAGAAEAPAEFRVPTPADPEYADYQEMLRHSMFRSSVENSAGYAPPYDPEWRSAVTGRREAGPVDLDFVGGARSLEELGRFVLLAAVDGDGQGLLDLAVTKDEFELILWPEFPQSRPYLRIPSEEAWSFHYADLTKGISRGGLALIGRPYSFAGVFAGRVEDYANFRLLKDVFLIARDEDTNRLEEFSFLGTVAERRGRFKVYLFEE